MAKSEKRCRWVPDNDVLYQKYHDEEWGVPSTQDSYLFEMLLLESFQAGLSWSCILRKREAFRQAFDHFDVRRIAAYDQDKIEALMNNPAIVRNRRKIEAAVTNARIFLDIAQQYGCFSDYIWHFTGGRTVIRQSGEMAATSALSDEVSRDLKRRGMKFVGSTIVYSYLQAIGVINDHDLDCDFRHLPQERQK